MVCFILSQKKKKCSTKIVLDKSSVIFWNNILPVVHWAALTCIFSQWSQWSNKISEDVEQLFCTCYPTPWNRPCLLCSVPPSRLNPPELNEIHQGSIHQMLLLQQRDGLLLFKCSTEHPLSFVKLYFKILNRELRAGSAPKPLVVL